MSCQRNVRINIFYEFKYNITCIYLAMQFKYVILLKLWDNTEMLIFLSLFLRLGYWSLERLINTPFVEQRFEFILSSSKSKCLSTKSYYLCVCHLFVWLFATPWSVVNQAPLSMEFPRQKYWNGYPFPSPGDIPDPGIKPGPPTFQADSSLSEPPKKSLALSIFSSYTISP